MMEKEFIYLGSALIIVNNKEFYTHYGSVNQVCETWLLEVKGWTKTAFLPDNDPTSPVYRLVAVHINTPEISFVDLV